MKAALALFKSHTGNQLRLYFPTWDVDGRTLKGVNLLPHRCDGATCEYGDHVHVGVYDTPIEVVQEDCATLSDEQVKIVTGYLRGQLAVDRMIYDLEDLLNVTAA